MLNTLYKKQLGSILHYLADTLAITLPPVSASPKQIRYDFSADTTGSVDILGKPDDSVGTILQLGYRLGFLGGVNNPLLALHLYLQRLA